MLHDILTWECESCKRCGHCFRINWLVKNKIWESVTGATDGGGGSLCIDCFIELANHRNIEIKKSDFEIIEIFNP